MSENTPDGFAILLNGEGIIKEVIRDSINIFSDKNPKGQSFTAFLKADSIQKGYELISTVRKDGTAFNWEIHAAIDDNDCLLNFSGIEVGGGIVVIGTDGSNKTEKFLNGLMEMNNEQINELRSFLKESDQAQKRQGDWDIYNDISSLNNELANTQRKLIKKTAELERINELKDQMLGMAAHDLRNPLTLIQNFATFLMEDLEEEDGFEEQYELSKEIKESSEYMVKIIEDMLDISAIETGNVTLDKEETDLNQFLQRIVELNSTSAQKKNISLEFEPTPFTCTADIDPHKFRQVLNNLVSNAIKYSYPDTTTTVGVIPAEENDGNVITIYVADEGQGIPEKEVDKLFEPFAKIDVEATAGEKSTGLGLAISKRIVEAHGGKIIVETEVGEGSTFYVRLPV